MDIRSQVNTRAFSLDTVEFGDKKLVPIIVETIQTNKKRTFSIFRKSPINPLRIFHLVDISQSMERSIDRVSQESRLSYLKKSIAEWTNDIPRQIRGHIEHILIPFDSRAITAGSFKQARDFLNKLKQLTSSYSSNIYEALLKARESISSSQEDSKRNLVVLYTDGDQTKINDGSNEIRDEDILDQFSKLESSNTAVVNVGIGNKYNKDLLLKGVQRAGFGAFVELPVHPKDLASYHQELVSFINNLSSAPSFPIINFNQWFNHVINLSPRIREVSKTGSANHQSVVGYQNTAYSMAFVEEDKLEQAKITQEIKGSNEETNIIITKLEQSGLSREKQKFLKFLSTQGINQLFGTEDAKEEKETKIELNITINGERKKFFIDKDNPCLTIGRDPNCQISFINDNFISREHAKLEYSNGRLYIRDLHSRNGTWINGSDKTLEANKPIEIKAGDIISLSMNKAIIINSF